MPVRYTDWQTSKAHANAINDLHLASLPKVKLQKRIPGVGSSLIDGRLTPGVWMQPAGFVLGGTFSSLQDKGRGSLLVLAQGTSSNQTDDDPAIFQWREAIGDLFNMKRVTGLAGEMFTQIELAPYRLDDKLARSMDVITLAIVSWFREDRR